MDFARGKVRFVELGSATAAPASKGDHIHRYIMAVNINTQMNTLKLPLEEHCKLANHE